MEELIAKISEALKAKGLDAEAVDEAIGEALDAALGEGEEPKAPAEAETKEPEGETEEAEEGQAEGEAEEGKPDAEEAQEAEAEAQDLPKGIEEVDPTKIGEAPDAELEQANADNEELRKAIEGLLARIASLEEALQASGVLSAKEGAIVGIDEAKTPANNPQDDPMETILAEINRGRR